ncbi:iron donor protein CyaY [Babesia caballi]|uniref:Iron donor protein CyaY n=1 Tax=Babesia caballi TaxID=5871 RepID=A0AAV4M0V5_BABCB|nr:iron donor protein CyaY [Babesia caballi]
MSRSKRKQRGPSKHRSVGEVSSNPFDAFRRREASTFHRRPQKLDLYNLNEPLTLTHKHEPIEEHFEDDLSDHSEDGFRYTGDPAGLPQALEEHKLRRAFDRQEKETQRNLLSKLDSDFQQLDLEQFIRPRKAVMRSPGETEAINVSSAPDKYEENLRRLMVAPLQSRDGGELLRRMYAATEVATKCEIATQFMKHGHVSTDAAAKGVVEVARPLSQLLAEPAGLQQFSACFDTLAEFVHYLCQRNVREYHSYFTAFLRGVYVSFEKDADLSLEALVVLYLLLKVAKAGAALYKAGLIALERLMERCAPAEDAHERVRLLLAMAYSATLDSGLYMPFFFKLAMRTCVEWSAVRPEVVETVLDMVTVALRLLSSKDCHVYPVCLHIVTPNIARLQLDSPKLDRLKAVVKELSEVQLLPNVLDVYKRPKVELQVPKYGHLATRESARDASVKREKALYKSLKKGFLQTAAAEAKARSLELQQRRARSKERYRKVMRDAMVEQEELRKEMLRLFRRFSGSVKLHRFNEAALDKLQALHDKLETVDELSAISFDGTVLTAEIDAKRYIVINKHEASQQIWYSSFNGVDYFAPEGGRWISTRSGRELGAVVREDVLQATGQRLDIGVAGD